MDLTFSLKNRLGISRYPRAEPVALNCNYLKLKLRLTPLWGEFAIHPRAQPVELRAAFRVKQQRMVEKWSLCQICAKPKGKQWVIVVNNG